MSRFSPSWTRLVPVIVVGALALGCGGDATSPPPPPPPPPAVAAVVLSQATAALVPQQTVQLSAVTQDAGGSPLSGRTVTWQSSAVAVASVSADGLVSGLAAGAATITATSEGKSASAAITVADGALIGPAGGVVLAAGGNAKLTIPAGALAATIPISVTPLPAPPLPAGVVANTAYELGPSGTQFAQPVTLEFKYQSTGIDSAQALYSLRRYTGGKWVALPGSSGGKRNHTVVATTSSFSTYAIALPDYGNGSLEITPATIGLFYGQPLQLTAAAFGFWDNPIPAPPDGTVWSDDGSFSAPVSSGGVVTGAVPGGPYRVYASQTYIIPCRPDPCYVGTTNIGQPNEQDHFADFISHINSGSANVMVGLIPVRNVTVTPSSATVIVGQTRSLLPVLKDSAGAALPLNFRTVTWATSNAAIASVSGTGVVTAVAPGPVTITATAEGVSGTSAITVTGSTTPVVAVVVAPDGQRVEVGATTPLVATPYDVAEVPVVGKTVVWSSGTPAVATVSADGVVSGVAQGQVVITATVDGIAGTIPVTVIAPLPLVTGSPKAGTGHSCLLRTNGKVWCWGQGTHGELGDGSTTATQPVPVPVAGGATFAALALGGPHSCALDQAGQTWCWGDFNVGVVGSSPVKSLIPVEAAVGKTFTKLYAGPFRNCGLDAGGAAWCWGQSRLGDGTTQTSYVTPVQVVGGLQFASLSVGWFSCGLTTAGAAWCWGNGSLGNGTTESSAVPVPVSGGHQFIAIDVGDEPAACGLKANGEIWCWGANSQGLLGDGSQVNRTTPVKVLSGVSFTAVSVGGTQTCALAQDQTAWCWGAINSIGAVPSSNLGGTLYRLTPVPVFGGRHFSEISSGGFHTCARATDGTWCWGFQDHGQLGFGNPALLSGQPPTKVTFP